MKGGSLRLRLFLAGAVSVAAALALSAFGLTLLFERHVERRFTAELDTFLDQVVAGIDRNADGRLILSKAPADPRFEQPLSGLYWQIQAGSTVLRSRSLWDSQLDFPEEAHPDGTVHLRRIAGPGGAELVALERGIALPPRLGGGTVRAVVGLDDADISAASRAFATDLLPYLAFIYILLMAAAYAQVAVGLQPLAAVSRRLAAIREGGAKRLGRRFPHEILPLAAEVDALLDAREAQIDKARARAADLAHALKTPLQVLTGDAGRLRAMGNAAAADEIEQVAMAMRRHVDRELARARIAAGAGDARARIAEVVERVLAVVLRTPAGARLAWSVDIADDLVGRIDPDDLAEALGNLIENAAHHAEAAISIRARTNDGLIVVTVADDGPGIPADRLEKALARGGRLDEGGEGSGLGLAIVRDIAEAWGGKFDIRGRAVGLEAEFSLRC